MTEDEVRLWHVTVTVAGVPMEPLIVRGALQRLNEQRPFISTLRFSADRAEIGYWDEAETLVDAASLGLRLWNTIVAKVRQVAVRIVDLLIHERHTKASFVVLSVGA